MGVAISVAILAQAFLDQNWKAGRPSAKEKYKPIEMPSLLDSGLPDATLDPHGLTAWGFIGPLVRRTADQEIELKKDSLLVWGSSLEIIWIV